MGVAEGPRGLAAWGKVIRLASCNDRLSRTYVEGQSLGHPQSQRILMRGSQSLACKLETVFFRAVSYLIETSRSKIERVHHLQGMGDLSDSNTC